MKRVLGIFLAMALILSFSISGITEVYSAESDGLIYTISNNSAQITGHSFNTSFNPILPSILGGFPVTSIGDYAFSGLGGLTSLTLPSTVTSIGSYTFQSCTGLKSLVIPNAVTSIGDYAFSNCSGLTSLTIGTSVKSIGNATFKECAGLTSVNIGNRVESIGEEAFSGCTGLDNVSMGNNVTIIGEEAFKNCLNMKTITIGVGVKSIELNAFLNCIKLSNVVIPNSVTSIGNYAFQGCGLSSVTIGSGLATLGTWVFDSCAELTKFSVSSSNAKYCSQDEILFDKAKTYLIQYPNKKAGSYTIPNSVKYVGNSSFKKCLGLTSVTIGSGVTNIGDYAFLGCVSLTSAHFLGNAPGLGWDVFGQASPTFKVYYIKGETGFTNPWNKYTTVGENASASIKLATPKVSIVKANSTSIKGTAAKGSTVYAKIGSKIYSAKVGSGTGNFSIKIPKIKKGTSVVVYCKAGSQTSGKITIKAV